MALNKRSIELPMIGGLDTKTDSKQVKVGKLLSAKNITYRNPGRIDKRNGFNSLSNTRIDTNGQITDGQALMTYRNELLAFDKQNIYSYVAGNDGWKDKGDFQSIYLTSESVSNGAARDFSNDNAYHPSGLQAYVFIREVGGVKTLHYEVIDSQSKQIIVGPVPVIPADDIINPRIIRFQDQFVIYYYRISDTRIYSGILPINNLVQPVTFDFITQAAANRQSVDPAYPAYDVAAMSTAAGDFIYLTYNATESGSFYIMTNRYSGPGTSVYLNQAQILTASAKFLQLFYDAAFDGPGIAFTKIGTTFNVGLYFYASGLTGFFSSAQTLPVNFVPNRVNAVAVGETQGNINTLNVILFLDYEDISTNRLYLRAYRRSFASLSVLWTEQQLLIAGGAFAYNNRGYVIAIGGANILTTQTTYFVIDETGSCIGRFASGVAGGVNTELYSGTWDIRWVPKTNMVSSTEFLTSLRTITTTATVSGQTLTGLSAFSFDFFEPERSYANAEIAKSLYLGGGMLFQYDGQGLVEDGFNWRPAIENITPLPAGPGNVYKYVAVWEWVDNNGYLHQSAPSDPYEVITTLAIGAGGNGANIRLYPLSLTYKTLANNRSPIQCVLYRTKVGGSEYYKLPVTNANANDPDVLFITPATDTTLDSQLVVPLYDNGNVLSNDNPPPVGALAVYRNRLFVLDSTNPLVIYYSKVVNIAETVQFSDGQLINVDPSGGPVTGMVSMDDKLIIFKENSIRFLSGQGPGPSGENDDFQGTTLITTDAGCTNLRSIVSTPDGVIFKSSKGVYFLNRGLQVSYIGAPVEQWNDDFITSGVLMRDVNQVRLTLDSGIFLVYDYFVDNWATFTNLYAVDSCIWNSTHAFIKSTGLVPVEDPTIYSDDGTPYPMEFTTNWFQFGGVQGYQRFWAAQLLGEFKSAHDLQIELFYNYNNAYSQVITVVPTAPAVYGTGVYGVETPYGGVFDLYQYEIRPSVQKCMSFKMRVSDVLMTAEGYNLSNVRLSYGVIGGKNRLPDTKVFG